MSGERTAPVKVDAEAWLGGIFNEFVAVGTACVDYGYWAGGGLAARGGSLSGVSRGHGEGAKAGMIRGEMRYDMKLCIPVQESWRDEMVGDLLRGYF